MNNTIFWGDIFWINFGDSFGCEQRGVRPALVVQNNKGNAFAPTVLVCPITSKNKKNLPTHISIGQESGLSRESVVLFEQVTCVDKTRVMSKIGHIDGKMKQKIIECLTISFDMCYNGNT